MSEREERQPRVTRELLARHDIEWLMLQPQFQRFCYTIFASAPMFTGTYGTDGRHLAFSEGRRSLAFDILRTVERARPDALTAIMSEEMRTQKEAPNAKRTYDRIAELDGPSGSEPGRKPGDGLVYLEYADEPAGAGDGSSASRT